jgi:hypothetical protein
VRRIAIHSFGTNQNSSTDADLRVGAVTNARIELCVVGSGPDSFTAQAEIDTGDCIRVVGGDGGHVERSLIGWCGGNGVAFGGGADNWTIETNGIRGNGASDTATGGVLLDSSTGATVRGNRIWENRAEGVSLASPTGPATLVNNTIARNGAGGAQTAGVRLFGTGNVVDRNEITENQGAGVMVTSASRATRSRATRSSRTALSVPPSARSDRSPRRREQRVPRHEPFLLAQRQRRRRQRRELAAQPSRLERLLGGNLTVTGWARPVHPRALHRDRDPLRSGGETWIATRTGPHPPTR